MCVSVEWCWCLVAAACEAVTPERDRERGPCVQRGLWGTPLSYFIHEQKRLYFYFYIRAAVCGFFLLTEFPERESETGEAESGVRG